MSIVPRKSLQYLCKKKLLIENVKDEAEFLPADKYESLLQTDSMILMGIAKHSQSSLNSKFTMSL